MKHKDKASAEGNRIHMRSALGYISLYIDDVGKCMYMLTFLMYSLPLNYLDNQGI
jgi:hypothetical protein